MRKAALRIGVYQRNGPRARAAGFHRQVAGDSGLSGSTLLGCRNDRIQASALNSPHPSKTAARFRPMKGAGSICGEFDA